MVLWILNLCMIGKASSHRVPISAALGQNACSLLGYEVWCALYMKEVVYWMFSSQRHWGHRILLSTGHQGPAQERVLCFEILLVSMLIICSNQTHKEPPVESSPVPSAQHQVNWQMGGLFPRKWAGLAAILQWLEMQKKRKAEGTRELHFWNLPWTFLSLRVVFCKL